MQDVTKITAVKLCPLAENNIETIHKYLNNVKLSKTYPIATPYTLQEATSYVHREMRCRKTGTRQAFAIIVKDEFTGVCALYDIERTARKAKLYYWVAVAYWNKGIASKALQQLIAYAKDDQYRSISSKI